RASWRAGRRAARRGKVEPAADMARISSMVRVVSVRQKHPNGLGPAVLVARDVVGDEPFAVLLGDDIFDTGAGRPGIGQLIDVATRFGKGAIAVMEVAPGQEQLYGVVAGDPIGDGLVNCRDMVEQPAPGAAPSRPAVV